jgi:hypothetical protein
VTDESSPAGAAEPQLAPLDVDGVGAVRYGTTAWAVAAVLCLVFRTPLGDAGRAWWLWVCATGAVLGLAGIVFVRRRAAAYRARALAREG